jgi:hypothetical protein
LVIFLSLRKATAILSINTAISKSSTNHLIISISLPTSLTRRSSRPAGSFGV